VDELFMMQNSEISSLSSGS